MDKNVFRLSDSAKCDLLFDALNTTEDSYKIVCDIYDDYAIAYDAVNNKYLRAYYTKDNEANTIAIDRIEDCYIVDVTESEMTALNAMKAMGSFAEINSKLEEQTSQIDTFTANVASLEQQLTDANAKIAEYEANAQAAQEPEPATDNSLNADSDDSNAEGVATDSSLEEGTEEGADPETDNACGADDKKKKVKTENELAEEIESYKAQLAEKDAEISRLNNSISDINNEKSELENFKKTVDTEKKNEIIKEFSASLSDEQITEFSNKMDDYSVEDFKKEVCFAAYNADSSIIGGKKDESENDLIYKNNDEKFQSGVLRLLNKHKGGNK